jgi:hypothetical protein
MTSPLDIILESKLDEKHTHDEPVDTKKIKGGIQKGRHSTSNLEPHRVLLQ